MQNLSANLLLDKFNMYYENAKKAHENKQFELAKRNYYLAAETLLKLAKISSPELKKARIDRAKRLIVIADSIEKENINKQDRLEDNNCDNTNKGKDWVKAEKSDIRFSDIAGLDDVKKSIRIRMINPLLYPEKYQAYRKKTGGGVLLFGPPGTGKTMIAKAIANEVNASFYAVKGSDIVSKWVGESEKNINSLFETARKEKLAIIFIDEIDSLIAQRGNDTHNDKRVNEFLQQIDGFVGKNPNLLLLGATNLPWNVDNAAMRSGRFSEKIYIPLPDDKAREFLIRKSLKNVPIDDDIDVDELVELTKNYSGADIDELCDRAKDEPLLKSIKNNELVNVSMRDFYKALKYVKPSADMKMIKKYEEFAGINNHSNNEEKEFSVKKDNKTSNDKYVKNNKKNEIGDAEKKIIEEGKDSEDNEYSFTWDNLPTITFEDVAGLDDVKKQIQVKVLLPLKHPEAFEGYVKNNGGGILLYGPPGTGKTMIAAAIANEIGAKFCSVTPSDLLHQGVGNSEKAVRSLFNQARKFKTCVIYFDEMDSITPKKTQSQYAKQLRSEFLSQLQGIKAYGEQNDNILLLVAATNKPWDIDSAFLRPGRFGTKVYVGLPDEESRKYIIERRLNKLKERNIVEISSDINIDEIVQKTSGFNGSDITNLLDETEEKSILRSIDGQEKIITQQDFLDTLENVESSVQKEDIIKLAEWKEN